MQNRGLNRSRVLRVEAQVKCICNKVSLQYHKLVQPVVAKEQIIADPCTQCRGQGRIREEKTLSVKIPAGVDEGDRIRFQW